MKQILLSLALIFLQFVVSAQVIAPEQGFPFQGIARESNGLPVSNTAISLSLSVSLDSNSTPLYNETHKTSTDAFGLFKVVVGKGNAVKSSFSSLTWDGPSFLSVAIDTKGGSNYVKLGTTQILPVPTAKYAEKAGNSYWQKADNGTISYSAGSIGINSTSDKAPFTSAASPVTQAIWGVSTPGISLQQSWPGIGFNHYYKDGQKSIAKGHGGYIGVDPLYGGMYFRTIANSAGADQPVVLQERMFIAPTGGVGIGIPETGFPMSTLVVGRPTGLNATATFRGSIYNSSFHSGSNEETIISGGKDGASVHINPGNIGNVSIVRDGGMISIANGLNAPTATLDVGRGPGANGTAIFRGTKHVSHFNHSKDENTYIRGGKDSSDVYINDNKIGDVHLVPDGGDVYLGENAAHLQTYLSVNGTINVSSTSGGWGVGTGLHINDVGVGAAAIIVGKAIGLSIVAPKAISTVGDIDISGNIAYSGTIANSSDKRYKKDIVSLPSSLSKVLNLHGVNYRYKSEEFPEKKFNDRLQIGFIAQEVREVVPELVSEDKDGYLSVDYSKVTPLLVEAIKELKKMIDTQNEYINQLKSTVSDIQLKASISSK